MDPDESIAATRAATLDDVKRFHREFYAASHAEVGVVGDFDPDEIEAEVERIFAGFESRKPYARLAHPYQARAALRRKIEAPDKESAFLLAGLRIDMRDDAPDYPALTLGNFMTGGGFLNSRLATRIRQKEGLSYGVRSWFQASAFERDALFGSYAIYAPHNARRLVEAYTEELARIVEDGFAAEEIAEAKRGWLQSRRVSRSNDRELARTLATRELEERSLAWDEALESRVESLDGKDILRAMKRAIDPAKISIVQAGDFAKTDQPAASAEARVPASSGSAPGSPAR